MFAVRVSEHREHLDRWIVNTWIGIVNAPIGIVNTDIGIVNTRIGS